MNARIFVTVGTQLPFDRLGGAVDAWAGRHPEADVFAQIGAGMAPRHLEFAADLDPRRFARCVETADVIVAHAGMGTILTALDLGKSVLVMPRRAALGEHRNEHQLATVSRLAHLDALHVVDDELAVARGLDALLAERRAALAAAGPSPARLDLLQGVAAFVSGLPLAC